MNILNDSSATATMEYQDRGYESLGYGSLDVTPQQALAALGQVRDLLARWNARTEVETADGYLRRIQAALGEPAPRCPLEATHTYFTGTCLHCGQPCGPADAVRGYGR